MPMEDIPDLASLDLAGIADQHQGAIRPFGLRRRQRLHHQLPADAVALTLRLYRDGADHHQIVAPAVIAMQMDGPALDRADQHVVVPCGEAETGKRGRIAADLVGGARVAIGTECAVEQRLHGGSVDGAERHESDHGGCPCRPDAGGPRA